MRGLEPPPKEDTPSRIAARMGTLLVLLFLFGVFVWAAVTNQRIPLVEDRPLDTVTLEDESISEGIRFNVRDVGQSQVPVFLFHDVDIAGHAMLSGLIDSIDGELRTVAVDLPGFGLSTRIPRSGPLHTVSDMAERLAPLIEERVAGPVIVAGVGLGAEVAAELAVTRPELVAGVLLIDLDLYGSSGWVETFEKLPFLGTAVTYAWEVSGPFSGSAADPYCDEGGYCVSEAHLAARNLISGISLTTESLQGFRSTPRAANVPSLLGDIAAPTVVVWSEKGPVERDSIDRVVEAIPDATLETYDVFQAIHESTEQLARILSELAS